jgi:O-antigen/teichoic acid export membrane protein
LIVSSLFSPLLPAVSSMQTTSTPAQIGEVNIRVSRYCALVLCMLALPLLIFAFPLLSLWVGRDYAARSSMFLQILVLGNLIRQLGYPYSLIVIATGRQHLATFASVAEAVVNIVLSVWLASKIGAVGVAAGTLVGAFVSLGLHLAVSMRLTRSAIGFPTSRFLLQSLLRPLACTLPVFLLAPSWRRDRMLPSPLPSLAAWIVATMLVAGLIGLTRADRENIRSRLTGMRRFFIPT